MLFKNSVRISKRTPHFTITTINWLTLFKEIITVYSENHTESINTERDKDLSTNETPPLLREGDPQRQKPQLSRMWPWASQGARNQDELTEWPSVVTWLWLWPRRVNPVSIQTARHRGAVHYFWKVSQFCVILCFSWALYFFVTVNYPADLRLTPWGCHNDSLNKWEAQNVRVTPKGDKRGRQWLSKIYLMPLCSLLVNNFIIRYFRSLQRRIFEYGGLGYGGPARWRNALPP
jgi:hypothetical protein